MTVAGNACAKMMCIWLLSYLSSPTNHTNTEAQSLLMRCKFWLATHVPQARLDEEQAALARRQASYARDHDSLTTEDEDTFERAVEEAAFRTSILQKRLARHEETALQQYYQLDKQLKVDPRLSMLQKPLL
jgi:hypothetical protein